MKPHHILFFLLLLAASVHDVEAKKNATLSAAEAAKCAEELRQAWLDSVRVAMNDAFSSQVLQIDTLTMPLHWSVYGEAPADGYSLYISLHGGGGASPEVNDSQWRNQWRLYHPDSSVYLCPRALVNAWNMHFITESDLFYQRIIHMAVACMGVNHDKVYLMGYSAGGDGVWRLAPRMADSWAAASMMAGHPGDVSLLGLRNTPFMIWCGAQDAAYERNKRCAERILEMDSLQHADAGGYVHEGHILEGKGHWMNLEDARAVEWMARFRRNPYPDRVVWVQGDAMRSHFYWLTAPDDEQKKGMTVRADIVKSADGKPLNIIRISQCDYSNLTLSLNDRMVNLDNPIRVEYKGKTIFKGRLHRSAQTLRRTLWQRGDPSYAFPAQLKVTLN
ncbi:MAG: alpha/beta hydrolase [Bacteroidaceae bacterium]|nr:alpha/beta hydrolase [Bacteroidaceae bacterium]